MQPTVPGVHLAQRMALPVGIAPVAAQRERLRIRHADGLSTAEERCRPKTAHRQRRHDDLVRQVACALQVPGQPAGGDAFAAGRAQFHILHGVKMTACVRCQSGRMDDGQFPILIEIEERRGRRVQTELIVERERCVLARDGQRDVGPAGFIGGTIGPGDGRHDVQPVAAAAQEHDDQNVLIRLVLGAAKGDVAQASAGHGRDRRRAADQKSSACCLKHLDPLKKNQFIAVGTTVT